MTTATLPRKALREAISMICSTTPRLSAIPTLNYARITLSAGTVVIESTNLDQIAHIALEADVSGEVASFLIKPQHLQQMATGDGGEIEITYTPPAAGSSDLPKVRIAEGGTIVTLQCTMAVSDFPTDIATQSDFRPLIATTSRAALHRLLRLTQHCISNEETRYYLNGVYLASHEGKLRAVATDGRRLARIDSDIDVASSFTNGILPRDAAKMLLSLTATPSNEPVYIFADASRVRFSSGYWQYTTKLIDGTYPDYTRVIPKMPEAPASATVTATAIKRLARLSSLIAGHHRQAARVITNGLSYTSKIDGDVTVPCTAEAFHEGYGFNIHYLAAQAAVTPTYTIRSDRQGGNPVEIVTEDPNALWVLMPMIV